MSGFTETERELIDDYMDQIHALKNVIKNYSGHKLGCSVQSGNKCICDYNDALRQAGVIE